MTPKNLKDVMPSLIELWEVCEAEVNVVCSNRNRPFGTEGDGPCNGENHDDDCMVERERQNRLALLNKLRGMQ